MKQERSVHPLGKYIQFSFVLFSVIPMILACCICMILMIGIYERNNRQELEFNIRNASEELEQWLGDASQLLCACAENRELITQMQHMRTLNSDGRAIVNALLTSRSGLQLHLLSSNGAFRYSTGSIPNLYKMPTYQNSGIFRSIHESNGGIAVRATKYSSYNGQQIALTLGTSIRNEAGEEIGFALLDVCRDQISDILDFYDALPITDILLAGSGNTVCYSRSGRFSEGLSLQDGALLELLRSESTAFLDEKNIYRVSIYDDALVLLVTTGSAFSRRLYMTLIVGLAVMLLIAAAIAMSSGAVLSHRISCQLSRLLEAMRRGPQTGFTTQYEQRNGDFSEIIQLGEYYNEMNRQARDLISSIEDKQRLLANAELTVLKMQMRPHFIYNMLNDIKSLAKLSRTREISELVVCFSALMRSSLSTEEEFYTLAEELDLVEKYVHMQNLRTTRSVELRLDVDESLLSLEIPRLILQPLVENSLSHGLVRTLRPIIRISARKEGRCIRLTVADNGDGVRHLDRPKPMDGINYHTGIGLSNISQRLSLYYGSAGTLQIRSIPGHFTLVTLTLLEHQHKEC